MNGDLERRRGNENRGVALGIGTGDWRFGSGVGVGADVGVDDGVGVGAGAGVGVVGACTVSSTTEIGDTGTDENADWELELEIVVDFWEMFARRLGSTVSGGDATVSTSGVLLSPPIFMLRPRNGRCKSWKF